MGLRILRRNTNGEGIFQKGVRHLQPSRKCKLKLPGDFIFLHSECLRLKKQKTTNTGKVVGNWTPLCAVGRRENQYSHYGNQYEVSSKSQKQIYPVTQIHHSWTYSQGLCFLLQRHRLIRLSSDSLHNSQNTQIVWMSINQ